jgi:hypothetical protein
MPEGPQQVLARDARPAPPPHRGARGGDRSLCAAEAAANEPDMAALAQEAAKNQSWQEKLEPDVPAD